MTYQQQITRAKAIGAAILGDLPAAREGGNRAAMVAAYARRHVDQAMEEMKTAVVNDPRWPDIKRRAEVWGRIGHRLIMTNM